MKIGIIVNDLSNLKNWEIQIIEFVKSDPHFELSLLIKIDCVKNSPNRKISTSSYPSIANKISEYIIRKQILIEKRKYLNNSSESNKLKAINDLKSTPTMRLATDLKNHDLDFDNYKKLEKFNLDLIISNTSGYLPDRLINVPKYGIWSIIHSDISLNKGGLPGFWEVVLKTPVVTVLLIEIVNEGKKGRVIDTAYYNTNSISVAITNNIIKVSSISLLIKNLKLINSPSQKDRQIIDYSALGSTAPLSAVLKYVFGFGRAYLKSLIQRKLSFSEIKKSHWTFFIGKGDFLVSDITSIEPVKVPLDQFWADPFLFKFKDQLYVFFENYSFDSNKGKISCGRIDGNSVVEIVDVLNLAYHLAYPFVFEDENEIYLMPDTGNNNQLEIYKCIEFPDKWEIYTTKFKNEIVFDPFFHVDSKGQRWLFVNKKMTRECDNSSELYIYKVDSVKMDAIVPHTKNPVLIDSRIARNGGAIFKHNNKWYRPSQRNTKGIYGRALNVNQIIKLDIDEYIEVNVKIVEPGFQKDVVSMHHLHQIDDFFVFDAAFEK